MTNLTTRVVICLFHSLLLFRFLSHGLSTKSLSSKYPENHPLSNLNPNKDKDKDNPKSQSNQNQKNYKSLGQAISSITSVDEALEWAHQFWLPTDHDLPPHYRHQLVHHETRQRWASQLLQQLAGPVSSHSSNSIHSLLWEQGNQEKEVEESPSSSPFSRLVLAAAMPHETSTNDRLEKEGQWVLHSLQALHVLAGRYHHHNVATTTKTTRRVLVPSDELVLNGIQHLIQRACDLALQYPLDQACQVLWAIQGLQARIPCLLAKDEDDNNSLLETLKNRVSELPFEVFPQCFDWSELLCNGDNNDDDDENRNVNQSICHSLIQVIPFCKDTILTKQGTMVTERRGTAWIAEEGIGALAYSGKLMEPHPIPPMVSRVMRKVEHQLDLEPNFFDCALCNHYPDAKSACKFHTDPEHGSLWHRTNVVVAAGTDRTFCFKPIHTDWHKWDPLRIPSFQLRPAAMTRFFAGDLVLMKDDCNDEFYHAVHAGETQSSGISDGGVFGERISLVLKRAIDRNGQKGHGLHGQGRRSKRKRRKVQNTN